MNDAIREAFEDAVTRTYGLPKGCLKRLRTGHSYEWEAPPIARDAWPLMATALQSQTAPAVPDAYEMPPYSTVDRGSKNYKAGWNAYRKAMLATAPQPDRIADEFQRGFEAGKKSVIDGGRERIRELEDPQPGHGDHHRLVDAKTEARINEAVAAGRIVDGREPGHSPTEWEVVNGMTCEKHGTRLEWLPGRNAHPSNRYCPACDEEPDHTADGGEVEPCYARFVDEIDARKLLEPMIESRIKEGFDVECFGLSNIHGDYAPGGLALYWKDNQIAAVSVIGRSAFNNTHVVTVNTHPAESREEIPALREDAERWRWFRDNARNAFFGYELIDAIDQDPEKVERAIDAARLRASQQEGGE